MKIKSKLLLAVLLPSFLIIGFISLSIAKYTSIEFHNQVFKHLETTAESRKNHVETYFEQQIERLKLITSRTKLRQTLAEYNDNPKEEHLETVLSIIEDAAAPIPSLERICIINLEGKVIISTDQSYLGTECEGKDFYLRGKEKEDVFFVEDRGQLKIYVSGPLILNDELIGVAISVVNIESLSLILSEDTGIGETGEVLLAFEDDNHHITYISERKFSAKSSEIDDHDSQVAKPMKDALHGEQKRINGHLDYRGEEVIAVSKYLDDFDLGLVAKIDHKEAFASLDSLLRLRIVMIVIAYVFFVFLILRFSRKITRPIHKLQIGVEKIKRGDLDHKVGTKSKDEVGMLSRAFDEMTLAIKQSRAEIDQKVYEQTEKIQQTSKDVSNQRKAILNVLEDVADEKQFAEKQSKELEKFQLAVEHASDHIVITDAEGIVLYANSAVERITGFSNQEVIGKKAGSKELWGGLADLDTYKKLWNTIKSGENFVGEIKNKRKNGQEYIAIANISPVLNDKDEVVFFVGIERDVTREKEIDRMKTEFISLASHQLRTPLSAMKWFLEMLLAGDAGELSKEQKEMVENVDQSNQRMIALVNGLLNISRIESGRIIVEPKPTDLNELVNELLIELEPKIKEKELSVICSKNERMGKISVDPNLTIEVYRNLLTNAIKYTPKKGEITVLISKDKENVISQISDNGLGIPVKDQEKMFEKFHRASNVTKTETDGTGLGLYLTKAIVESSHGKIWFESKEGDGTTFWFSLPLSGMKAKEGEVRLGEGHLKSQEKKAEVKKEPQSDTKEDKPQKGDS